MSANRLPGGQDFYYALQGGASNAADYVYRPSLNDYVYRPSLGDYVYRNSLGDYVYRNSLGDDASPVSDDCTVLKVGFVGALAYILYQHTRLLDFLKK